MLFNETVSLKKVALHYVLPPKLKRLYLSSNGKSVRVAHIEPPIHIVIYTLAVNRKHPAFLCKEERLKCALHVLVRTIACTVAALR